MFDPEVMEAYYQEQREKKTSEQTFKEDINSDIEDVFSTLDYHEMDPGEFVTIHRDGHYVTEKEQQYKDQIESSSYRRYHHRLGRFKDNKSWPRTRHTFWWLMHNCVAHIAIGFVPIKASFSLHDWTSDKLNLK